MSSRRQRTASPQQPDPGLLLQPGEEVINWSPVQFATGLARNVAGRRWFRDPAGNDIEPLLEQAGWPPRRVAKRPAGSRFPAWLYLLQEAATSIWNVVAILLAVVTTVASAFSSTGGGTLDLTIKSVPTEYRDTAIESDDFPVMCAPPRSVAASVPWQLDPDRSPRIYAILLLVTTGRLLMVQTIRPPRKRARSSEYLRYPKQIIWQAPRNLVAQAERRRYSTAEADIILRFTDGSWIRVNAQFPDSIEKALGASAA